MSRRFDRLLVAGAAGFIGSNFVRLLRRERPETEVWVLDKLTYAGNPANLAEFEGQTGYRFVQGDICDQSLVDQLAAEVDAIVNFAAETHVDRSLMEPFAFVNTDVLGTAVLCEAARRHRHQVFHLVSTDEVYGDVPEGRSVEDDALRPRSPYAASKAGGEHLARAYGVSHGLPLLITRGSNNYGPFQYPEKSVPVFITNAIDDLPIPLYNDGSAVRDYCFVEDHCRGIDTVLHDAPVGGVYNLGTGVETSGNELAALVCDLLEKPRSLIQYVADRPGHDYRYAVDASRARALGWAPQVDFRSGLERTVRWYVEHEDWWRPLKSGDYWEYYRRNYRPLVPHESA
ncbi:MAG: dTDP-glucose 4,6-dehydratase [Candidatus Nephthysia bennettiae]|uniref:dTDP-glucose 4,6-dehydratase n=1 Tax=Candidatus Nephthysia bennettiae TaxID=3127016 RepID=A0A934K574_9BACT|nr:dTDP-glucose 4,6-dehydratase [Candidatus Dormibacteraeota bacterium]MBJ7613836.1 dTDP-glucose 4,6-dehydratase [Candidatus Dormibacteraeota bacterium]PZR95598.1 MAG: dTDP-glucose 4,6-dehydratase [Candidatus Dormibacteraeota bacterium]